MTARARLGFTLIEALAVIAVIAILATMAIPSYVDRIVREQITEALPLADVAEKPVAMAWASSQTLPADNAAAGLPAAEKIVNNYISSVAVQDGAVQITFGNMANGAIKGKVLTLRPAVEADAPVVPVAWVCGMAPVPANMTARGENRTQIQPSFLPYKCRAASK